MSDKGRTGATANVIVTGSDKGLMKPLKPVRSVVLSSPIVARQNKRTIKRERLEQ